MADPSLARSRAGSLSRPSTPGHPRPSPSRLAPPSLRPSPSLSNLNVQCHNALAIPQPSMAQPLPRKSGDHILDSSASSVIDVDTGEGMLIQDIDAETDQTDTEDIRSLDRRPPITNEGSKQLLRDQLRKTLSNRSANTELSRSWQKDKEKGIEDIAFSNASRYLPREYFVLTDAGKPVYISRPGGEGQDNMASTIGIMQALISVFIDDNDKIRSINAGHTRITFLQRPPLYYVCVSSWGEPESVTRTHLEYLHLQILSIVSGAQLKRIFERRTNFDLRRLLNGAESFMNTLLTRIESDLAMTMSSLHCLKLDLGLRKRIADALVPASKMKDMLYIMLVANNQIVTLIRPRKHSIHPADLHIIMNTLHSPSIVNSLAAASWLPVCLPKFNSSGFANIYISFIRKDDNVPRGTSSPTPPTTSDSDRESSSSSSSAEYLNESGVAFVCVTGNAEFDTIRIWSESVIQRLSTEGTLNALLNAHHAKQTVYSVSELGIPGLRHFVYKSRAQMQITLPTYEDPYDQSQARKRLTTLYQVLHDSINAKSGQEAGLKMQYIRTETESVMGWITQPFELYLSLSPLLPKSAAIGAANAVFRWVKKEETRLFLRDAPVF